MTILQLSKQAAPARTYSTRWLFASLTVILVALAFRLDGYAADIFKKLLLISTLSLSFNFLFGIAGQLAISHVAFYAIGAYTVTILSVSLGMPVWLAIPATIGFCGLVALAVAVPTVRLEGFYLALGTLALAQLVTVLLVQGGKLTGGPEGLYGFASLSFFGWEITGRSYAMIIVVLFLLILGLLVRLDRSWFGRACRAVRDNPTAARAMGIDITWIKVSAFVLTSALAGISGIAYAFLENYVTPYAFDLNMMFQILFMVIVGGVGRHSGAIIGAIILYLSPEYLGVLGEHYLLLYGVLTVACILFEPRGIVGLLDRIGLRLP
jgi:branched-chain amino acid transport system permease protein